MSPLCVCLTDTSAGTTIATLCGLVIVIAVIVIVIVNMIDPGVKTLLIYTVAWGGGGGVPAFI